MSKLIRHITHEKCLETVPIDEIFKEREKRLVRYQIINNIRRQSRNNRLGLIWLVINPLVTSLIYVFVFTVMRANLNAMNIIIGITLYRVFSVGVKSGVSSIKDYRGGVLAERVSTRVLIKGMMGNRIVDSLFQTIGACFVLCILFDVSIIHSVSLIFIATICGLMAEGFMLNFAKIIRNLPDLNNVIQHVIQLLFFATPVLYGFELTSGLHRSFNSINPIMYFIEFQRGLISRSYAFNEADLMVPVIIFTLISILSIRGYSTIDRVRWELSTWP